MMWAAGAVAAMSSITFPAVSALVSRTADPDQQGKTLAYRFISVAKQIKTQYKNQYVFYAAFLLQQCLLS